VGGVASGTVRSSSCKTELILAEYYVIVEGKGNEVMSGDRLSESVI
jgi:hypothetical protein